MSLIWLIPAAVAVAAALVTLWVARTAQAEAAALQVVVARQPRMRSEVAAVQVEVARTAQARRGTLDSLGGLPRR